MHFFDDRANSAWSSEPAGESGAGGLVSTLDDYFVFSRMLLNKGRLGMAVDIRRQEIYHTPGRFGWTGGFGTTAYTDLAERLIGILLTSASWTRPSPRRFSPISGCWHTEQ